MKIQTMPFFLFPSSPPTPLPKKEVELAKIQNTKVSSALIHHSNVAFHPIGGLQGLV